MAGVVHFHHALQGVSGAPQRFPGRPDYIPPGLASLFTTHGSLHVVSSLRRDRSPSRAGSPLCVTHHTFSGFSAASRRASRRRAPARPTTARALRLLRGVAGARRVGVVFLRSWTACADRESASASTGRVPKTGGERGTALRLIPGSASQCRQRKSVSVRHCAGAARHDHFPARVLRALAAFRPFSGHRGAVTSPVCRRLPSMPSCAA